MSRPDHFAGTTPRVKININMSTSTTGSRVGIFVTVLAVIFALGAAFKFRESIGRFVRREKLVQGWDSTRLKDLEENGLSDQQILLSREH